MSNNVYRTNIGATDDSLLSYVKIVGILYNVVQHAFLHFESSIVLRGLHATAIKPSGY
jgi:hypothetical protein